MIDGGRRIVDMDLAKFFDTVNHDRLMSRLTTRVDDKRVLKRVRRFLTAGVMTVGLVSPTSEGTPQGGPLSPLLSNIVLDELDKELEKRGPRFVRYIENRLRLEVNREKRIVGHPLAWGFNPRRPFLGFSFTSRRDTPNIRIHSKSIKRLKQRVRELTSRSRRLSVEQVIARLNAFTRGWWAHFRHAEVAASFRSINYWIRRRSRAII